MQVGIYLLGLYGILMITTTGIKIRLLYMVISYVSVHLVVNLLTHFLAGPDYEITFYGVMSVGLVAGGLGFAARYFKFSPRCRLRSAPEAWNEFRLKYTVWCEAALVLGGLLFLAVPWLWSRSSYPVVFAPIYLLTLIAGLLYRDE